MGKLAFIFMVLSYPGLFVSLWTVTKVRKVVEKRRLKMYWTLVWFMNIFFIITYAIYIYILTKGGGISGDSVLADTLISLMFLIGGGWVVFLTRLVGLSATERAESDLVKKQRMQIQEFNDDLGQRLNAEAKGLEKSMMELLTLMGAISKKEENLDELKEKLNNLKNKK